MAEDSRVEHILNKERDFLSVLKTNHIKEQNDRERKNKVPEDYMSGFGSKVEPIEIEDRPGMDTRRLNTPGLQKMMIASNDGIKTLKNEVKQSAIRLRAIKTGANVNQIHPLH